MKHILGVEGEAALQALLQPYPAAPMARYRVTTAVNSVKTDDASCFAPLNPALTVA